MKISEIEPNDVLVNVDKHGAGYYRVLKVNRVTIDVRGENGNKVRAYPHIFDRKVDYPVAIPPRAGSYGFTCGYCETTLDTPFDDSARAERFAQQQGWRLTLGHSPRWGEGANVTCPNCAAGDRTASPIGSM